MGHTILGQWQQKMLESKLVASVITGLKSAPGDDRIVFSDSC